MLVGGLGGIGRATAMWMIEHGARHLVLVNRSGTSKPEAQETLRALELKGATVKVCACDISDEAQVIGMLTTLSRVATPIKGVIQAAMLIRVSFRPLMTISSVSLWLSMYIGQSSITAAVLFVMILGYQLISSPGQLHRKDVRRRLPRRYPTQI